MSDTDLQLVTRYVRQSSEDAFAELVRRHLNLVFSAALRQVRSRQLAEEVAQSVFTDLARQAERLSPDTILTAWLYQVTNHTAIDVVRREARRMLREQVAVELTAMNATATDWRDVEPLLDEAMNALDATDRTAVLLRYFENKSFREVGQILRTTEDAARKRLSRAVDRLREFFTKRGVIAEASTLAVAISANAVQSAPVGLAAAITTAALSGTTITTATVLATTKVIAMTTFQKTIIGATLAVAIGTGIYEARQAVNARAGARTLQQLQSSLTERIERLESERNEATRRAASLSEENERLTGNASELLKLRGELLRLRSEVVALRQQAKTGTAAEAAANADYWPRDSWNLVGYESPAAALQSYFWAASKGEVENFRATVTGDAQKSLELQPENAAQAFVSAQVAGLKSVRVLSREVQADDTVVLLAAFEKDTGNEVRSLLMKKVGTEWKFSAYINN